MGNLQSAQPPCNVLFLPPAGGHLQGIHNVA